MRTTPDWRESIRRMAAHAVNGHGEARYRSADMVLLLDDFAEMEAELAALRRLEAEVEELSCERSAARVPERRWLVVGLTGSARGYGSTLAWALADYDAKKEQSND